METLGSSVRVISMCVCVCVCVCLTDSVEFSGGDLADSRVRTGDDRYLAVQPGLALAFPAEHRELVRKRRTRIRWSSRGTRGTAERKRHARARRSWTAVRDWPGEGKRLARYGLSSRRRGDPFDSRTLSTAVFAITTPTEITSDEPSRQCY